MVAAAARAALDSGQALGGTQQARHRQTVQLLGADTSGWTTALWEIKSYPETFNAPGWLLDIETGTYSFEATAATAFRPPSFQLTGDEPGKWDVELTVNGTLKDRTLRIVVPSTTLGLVDTAFYENSERSGFRNFARDVNRNWRKIDRAIKDLQDRPVGSSAPVTPPEIENFVFDILMPSKAAGTLHCATLLDGVTFTGGSTYNVLNYTGGEPGYVAYVLLAGHQSIFGSDSRIKVYIDGSATPDIDCLLGVFFCNKYICTVGHLFGTRAYSCNGDGFQACATFKIPIPFSTQIKIDVVLAASGVTTEQGWSTVEYHTGVPNEWPYTRRLHVTSINELTPPYGVNEVIPLTAAKGRYVGMYMLSDDVPGGQSPGLATLHGPITLYLDGQPAIVSTGAPDYFGAGLHGAGPGGMYNVGPDATRIWRTNAAASFSRHHWEDCIRFEESIRLTRTNGQASNIVIDSGNNTIWAAGYWYSEE